MLTEADFIIARLQRERLVFAVRALRAEMTIAALTVQLAYYKRKAQRGYHNGYDNGYDNGLKRGVDQTLVSSPSGAAAARIAEARSLASRA